MRYLPKSPAERQEMLSASAAESIDELFSSIPERFRLRESVELPGPLPKRRYPIFLPSARERIRWVTRAFAGRSYNHLRSRGYRSDHSARRVSYLLHAVSSGISQGTPAGHF